LVPNNKQTNKTVSIRNNSKLKEKRESPHLLRDEDDDEEGFLELATFIIALLFAEEGESSES